MSKSAELFGNLITIIVTVLEATGLTRLRKKNKHHLSAIDTEPCTPGDLAAPHRIHRAGLRIDARPSQCLYQGRRVDASADNMHRSQDGSDSQDRHHADICSSPTLTIWWGSPSYPNGALLAEEIHDPCYGRGSRLRKHLFYGSFDPELLDLHSCVATFSFSKLDHGSFHLVAHLVSLQTSLFWAGYRAPSSDHPSELKQSTSTVACASHTTTSCLRTIDFQGRQLADHLMSYANALKGIQCARGR